MTISNTTPSAASTSAAASLPRPPSSDLKDSASSLSERVDALSSTIPSAPSTSAAASFQSPPSQDLKGSASSLSEKVDALSTQFEGFTICNSVPVTTIKQCFSGMTLQESSIAQLNQAFEGLTIKKELGRGQYGAVFAIHADKINGEPVDRDFALKLLKVKDMSELAKARSIRVTKDRAGGEAIALWLQHKNLIDTEALITLTPKGDVKIIRKADAMNLGTLETYYDHTVIAVLSELFSGRELFEVLQYNRFTLTKIRSVAEQVGNALAYLHLAKITHRDIKPENILIDENLNAKLIDYGLCRFRDTPDGRVNSMVGTLDYLAPEIHLLRTDLGESYDEKVDSYSFGILLFFMYYLRFPWEMKNPNAVYDNSSMEHLSTMVDYSLSGKNLYEYFPEIDAVFRAAPLLRDLIIRLTHSDPEKRLSIAKALLHPFFSKTLLIKK